MQVILIGLAAVVGMAIGSFLNVVIHRVPAGRSLVNPPSACPGCETRINAYDNIPVLSWLVLRGRCRACGEGISLRYPLVEVGTAVLFGLVAARFLAPLAAAPGSVPAGELIAAGLALVAFLYLAGISVALAAIDLDTSTLPNRIVLPAYILGIVLLGASCIASGDIWALARAGIGMVVLFLLYLLLAIARPGGMGFGDVKLAGVLGLFLGWLGWGALAVGAFAAFLLGGLFATVLMIARRAGRTSRIPFGPWMLAGAWVGILFGDPLVHSYLALFGLA